MNTNVEPNDGDQETSLSLLRRAQANDNEAWVQLTELYTPLVFKWLKRWNFSDADAFDLAQEIFTSVMKYLSSFKRDQPGDSFRGWLRTITNSKVMDFFRAAKKIPEVDGGSNAQANWNQLEEKLDTPENSNEDKVLLAHKMMELISGNFSEVHIKAFLKRADEVPAKEIAEELGLTPAAVYSAVARIRRMLHEEFGDLGDNDIFET